MSVSKLNLGERFHPRLDIRQMGGLSPLLFNCVLEEVVRIHCIWNQCGFC